MGAQRVQKEGKNFRSRLEAEAYSLLKESGLSFEYEPKSIVLIKEFVPKNPWHEGPVAHQERIRAHTYTPDFVIRQDKQIHYIEMKGWKSDRYPLQRKLFLSYLQTHQGTFWECHTLRDLRRCLIKITSHDLQR